MNRKKLELLLKILGVGLAIAGLLCCLIKLCSRFDRLCKKIVDDDETDLGYII